MSAKRKPLLSAENSPKKQKAEVRPVDPSRAARKEKLARLAANLRKNDRADQGHDATLDDSQGHKRKSTENVGQVENVSPSKAAKSTTKSSRWAKFSEQQNAWDNDYREHVFATSPTKPVRPAATTATAMERLKPSSSARDMVAEALARRDGNTRIIQPNRTGNHVIIFSHVTNFHSQTT